MGMRTRIVCMRASARSSSMRKWSRIPHARPASTATHAHFHMWATALCRVRVRGHLETDARVSLRGAICLH
jgi:hypothetical protein